MGPEIPLDGKQPAARRKEGSPATEAELKPSLAEITADHR